MTNIKIILTLIVGIVIGISFTKLFQSNNSEQVPLVNIKNIKPTVLEKQVATTTEKYQLQIDSLNTKSNLLDKKLTDTKQILVAVKKKNLVLQTQVYDLIDQQQNSSDTLQNNNDCEMLQTKVVALLQLNNEKDSLYETVTNTLESKVKNKDSALLVTDLKCQSLQSAFNEGIIQQNNLFEQNKTYQKQFKRQKLKSKLLSAVVLVFSGVVANNLIQH